LGRINKYQMKLRTLPIIALNTVLFPGMPLPLFIFEERYRTLLQECQAADGVFGVSLIREGSEMGGPAVTYEIGTMAGIVQVQSREDSSLQVLAIGQQRFRMVQIMQAEPYLVAEVELVDECEGPLAGQLHDEMREMFRQHLQLIVTLMGQPELELPLPESPSRLSYMIAAHLTSPLEIRQQLLEMDSLAERLLHERDILQLESENYRLLLLAQSQAQKAAPTEGPQLFSAN
jgi:Lon protease-like protein